MDQALLPDNLCPVILKIRLVMPDDCLLFQALFIRLEEELLLVREGFVIFGVLSIINVNIIYLNCLDYQEKVLDQVFYSVFDFSIHLIRCFINRLKLEQKITVSSNSEHPPKKLALPEKLCLAPSKNFGNFGNVLSFLCHHKMIIQSNK